MKISTAIPLSLFFLTLLVSPTIGATEPDPHTQDQAVQTRERAVAAMRNSLLSEHGPERVRAAGYLIALDYRAGVRELLIEELERDGTDGPVRLAVWGALACADQNLEPAHTQWRKNIQEFFLDTDNEDRRVALDILCELDSQIGQMSPVSDQERAALEAFATLGDDSDRAAVWSRLLLAGDERAEANILALLNSRQAEGRRDSARSLRRQSKIMQSSWETLVHKVSEEPTDSPTRVYLVAALLKHVPDSEPNMRATLSSEVHSFATDGTTEERIEACTVLADVGRDEDVSVLVGLLDSDVVDVNVRLAAANALCRIDRRHTVKLGGLDWMVIAGYGIGMIAVGWFYSRRNNTAEDYLLGGRAMRSWTVGLSMFATLLSTISYLSYPGEAVRYGPMILSGIAVFPLIFLVVGYLLIPFIMKLKVTSAYEVLEMRMGLSIRMLGGIIFLLLRLLWMATIIYVTTSAIIIPMLDWEPAWTPVVCAVLGAVTVIYTSMGGLRAVVLTDVIQTCILFCGAILTMVLITLRLGGPSAWWPDHWLDHWPDPTWGLDTGARISFVGMMIAMFTWYVCTSGSDQMAIQRYLATRDAHTARRVLLIALASDALVAAFLIIVGLALLAYYTANPHALPDGQSMISGADRLFTRYIVIELPVGIRGLVIAGLLAAAMSSLSSGVNSSSSVIAIDFVERFRTSQFVEAKRLRLVKWLSFLVGAAVVGLSLYVALVPGNIVELAYRVVNLMVAPLFLLFFMAMFVPWATSAGTWVGVVVSTFVAVLIAYWEPLSTIPVTGRLIAFLQNNLGVDAISFLWIMPVSLIIGILTASAASILPIGVSRGRLIAGGVK